MLLVCSTIYGFLIGALIAACGNFVMLLMKYEGSGLNENCCFDGKSE